MKTIWTRISLTLSFYLEHNTRAQVQMSSTKGRSECFCCLFFLLYRKRIRSLKNAWFSKPFKTATICVWCAWHTNYYQVLSCRSLKRKKKRTFESRTKGCRGWACREDDTNGWCSGGGRDGRCRLGLLPSTPRARDTDIRCGWGKAEQGKMINTHN